MSEYSKKLLDPRWKQKRLEVIERAGQMATKATAMQSEKDWSEAFS